MEPAGCSVLPGAIVWRGDTSLPTSEQGFKVLGVPLGHPDFIERFLQPKIDEHRLLLERIPIIPDVQAAWLILSCCASAKSNFFLRGVSPAHSGEFALNHDEGIRQILELSPDHRAEEVAFLAPAPRRSWFEERTKDPPCTTPNLIPSDVCWIARGGSQRRGSRWQRAKSQETKAKMTRVSRR